MDKNSNQDLEILNWNQATQLAGGNRKLAEELMTILTKNLAHESTAIKNAFEQNQHDEFTRAVHKLRGALAYCGTPRIKKTINTLEIAIKNNIISEIAIQVDKLEFETKALLEHYHSMQQH